MSSATRLRLSVTPKLIALLVGVVASLTLPHVSGVGPASTDANVLATSSIQTVASSNVAPMAPWAAPSTHASLALGVPGVGTLMSQR